MRSVKVKREVWLLAVVIVATAVTYGCHPKPPLEGGSQSTSAAPAVQPREGDNAACLCCHMDFKGEDITEKHLAKRFTCQSCHGPSEPHRQDETLRTKPDWLWGRAEVSAFCRQCHEDHGDTATVQAFRQEWAGKARPNGRFIGKDAVCTDCHGEHTVPPKR
ncbi:MAG: hypothetical protein FJ279_29165 [Planctomycetes bacterium]|nr:hypothetical protein [Planctomycetota bacterium]MBM4080881.1 hypothetical protein [Planctomycetota bacterium]